MVQPLPDDRGLPRPRWDVESVEARLAEAGRTLLAWRVPGTRPAQVRSAMPEVVHDADDKAGWFDLEARLGPPGARALADMEQVLGLNPGRDWCNRGWFSLIPAEKAVLRRIAGYRMLRHANGDDPLMGWRRIGLIVGTSHEKARRGHGQALRIIADALNRPGLCVASGGRVGIGPDRPDVAAALRRATARAGRRSGVRELA